MNNLLLGLSIGALVYAVGITWLHRGMTKVVRAQRDALDSRFAGATAAEADLIVRVDNQDGEVKVIKDRFGTESMYRRIRIEGFGHNKVV